MSDALPDFTVQVHVTDGVGVLQWAGQADVDTLQRAVEAATDDVIMGHGVRRVEAAVGAGDLTARRALQRAGFRREGVRREALALGDGFVDVFEYARLAGDIAYGDGSFSHVMDSVLPTKRAIAHVLFRDEAGRYLFCSTSYKSEWELPGGVVEPDEAPRAGAAREVEEELGVALPVGGLLCIDWLPRYLGWSDALQLVFDGGVVSEADKGALRFADGEITALHWVDVADVEAHVYPGAFARLQAITSADPADLPLYLEGGRRV